MAALTADTAILDPNKTVSILDRVPVDILIFFILCRLAGQEIFHYLHTPGYREHISVLVDSCAFTFILSILSLFLSSLQHIPLLLVYTSHNKCLICPPLASYDLFCMTSSGRLRHISVLVNSRILAFTFILRSSRSFHPLQHTPLLLERLQSNP